MKTILLDFSGCKYFDEVHEVLKTSFDFPEYYGKNLSALWDCLLDYCDDDTEIIIKGIDKMPEESHEYMTKVLKVFARISEQNPSITHKSI